MSSTKKKLIYIILIIATLLSLGIAYVVLSNVKGGSPQENVPELINTNLVPGKSTKEDVIRVKGDPSVVSTADTIDLLRYELKEIDDSDAYAVKNGILIFYVENNPTPVVFDEFSRERGAGNLFYGEDEALIWHVYPSHGIGVAVAGNEIFKTLAFQPMEKEQFQINVGDFLGISEGREEILEFFPDEEVTPEPL